MLRVKTVLVETKRQLYTKNYVLFISFGSGTRYSFCVLFVLPDYFDFSCSVRHHQANSHAKKGWEQFTDAVIRSVSQKKEGVVFLLWGNFAQDKSRLIDERKHHILKAAHPSGLSANRGFFGCRHFSRTNQLLEKMGIIPIDWQL
ncbi:uracil-DNA glycosylase, mitochondrial-like [Carica papaya]|uniref:uracil-DNA glycosylase, mitochondrial-like n=1 Tax=Carica papaya TaxID=3649 RepID=UPI000B8CA5A5|nr:uracil-DNA glycosylase, mitochondrial-like [Carica papaya]